MKKLFLLSVIVSMFMTCNFASAQKELGIFNSVAVGLDVGSTGIGVDVATPITHYVALRGGVSFMPGIKINTDVNVNYTDPMGTPASSSMDVQGNLQRVQGEFLVNCYPFQKVPFFISAGAFFGGNKLVKINGHSDELAQKIAEGAKAGIEIGDYTIPVDEHGNVAGGLKVKGVRPYVGIGFGRAVPKKRIGVMVDLGVQIHGTPEVYTDYGNIGNLMSQVDPDDKFTKIIDKLKVYPVLKVRFCGRIF